MKITVETPVLLTTLSLYSLHVSAFSSSDTSVRRLVGSSTSLSSSREVETNSYFEELKNQFPPSKPPTTSFLDGIRVEPPSTFRKTIKYPDFIKTQGYKDEFLFASPPSYINYLKSRPPSGSSRSNGSALTKVNLNGLKKQAANYYRKATGPSSYLDILESQPKLNDERSKPSSQFSASVNRSLKKGINDTPTTPSSSSSSSQKQISNIQRSNQRNYDGESFPKSDNKKINSYLQDRTTDSTKKDINPSSRNTSSSSKVKVNPSVSYLAELSMQQYLDESTTQSSLSVPKVNLQSLAQEKQQNRRTQWDEPKSKVLPTPPAKLPEFPLDINDNSDIIDDSDTTIERLLFKNPQMTALERKRKELLKLGLGSFKFDPSKFSASLSSTQMDDDDSYYLDERIKVNNDRSEPSSSSTSVKKNETQPNIPDKRERTLAEVGRDTFLGASLLAIGSATVIKYSNEISKKFDKKLTISTKKTVENPITKSPVIAKSSSINSSVTTSKSSQSLSDKAKISTSELGGKKSSVINSSADNVIKTDTPASVPTKGQITEKVADKPKMSSPEIDETKSPVTDSSVEKVTKIEGSASSSTDKIADKPKISSPEIAETKSPIIDSSAEKVTKIEESASSPTDKTADKPKVSTTEVGETKSPVIDSSTEKVTKIEGSSSSSADVVAEKPKVSSTDIAETKSPVIDSTVEKVANTETAPSPSSGKDSDRPKIIDSTAGKVPKTDSFSTLPTDKVTDQIAEAKSLDANSSPVKVTKAEITTTTPDKVQSSEKAIDKPKVSTPEKTEAKSSAINATTNKVTKKESSSSSKPDTNIQALIDKVKSGVKKGSTSTGLSSPFDKVLNSVEKMPLVSSPQFNVQSYLENDKMAPAAAIVGASVLLPLSGAVLSRLSKGRKRSPSYMDKLKNKKVSGETRAAGPASYKELLNKVNNLGFQPGSKSKSKTNSPRSQGSVRSQNLDELRSQPATTYPRIPWRTPYLDFLKSQPLLPKKTEFMETRTPDQVDFTRNQYQTNFTPNPYQQINSTPQQYRQIDFTPRQYQQVEITPQQYRQVDITPIEYQTSFRGETEFMADKRYRESSSFEQRSLAEFGRDTFLSAIALGLGSAVVTSYYTGIPNVMDPGFKVTLNASSFSSVGNKLRSSISSVEKSLKPVFDELNTSIPKVFDKKFDL